MSTEIKTTVMLRRIDKYPPRFPCLCVPYWDGRNGEKVYRWEHADVVDSVIRGAGDYFEIIDIKPS
jgi:hypothetical protein